ncbi:MAG: radical SAM protein [Desulfobulbaceae bacterium]|nr:radical SAM protein [Desulfobulbaceae bacterium]
MKHLFGPVNSRRLGLSLGVDLVPAKICNFDCIYCEVGVTTGLTVKRREYSPTSEIIAELDEFFAGLDSKSPGWPDFVTLTSSGEPTLHTGIGEVIRYVKKQLDLPVAVLTNGSLLSDPQVRLDLLAADIVVPSLDAARAPTLAAINRPAPECANPEKIIEGLVDFAEEFGGEIWLEILLAADVNDSDEDIDALLAAVDRIRPDRVQLNTVVRPPAESWARPLPENKMQEIAGRFKNCRVEIVADYSGRAAKRPEQPERMEILEMLKRRPCTKTDICEATGLDGADVDRLLNELERSSLIRETMHDGRKYYQAEKRQ